MSRRRAIGALKKPLTALTVILALGCQLYLSLHLGHGHHDHHHRLAMDLGPIESVPGHATLQHGDGHDHRYPMGWADRARTRLSLKGLLDDLDPTTLPCTAPHLDRSGPRVEWLPAVSLFFACAPSVSPPTLRGPPLPA